MMVADIVRAAGSAVLAWGIIHGALEMSVLLVVATVAATCRVFHRPALQASIVQLVPESGLNRANSLFQLADAAANLIAPAAAGVIVAWLGEGAVVAISAATSVFAALTLLMARIPELPRHAGDAAVEATSSASRGGLVSAR
nr:hypothetical protein [Bacillota bacterium]